MKTIWKFEMPLTDNFSIEAPKIIKFLDIQIQNCVAYLWAIVETDTGSNGQKQSYSFRLFGTGHPITQPLSDLSYVGTYQLGSFVWHVFQEFK